MLELKSPSSGLDYVSNKKYDFAILLGPDEFLNKNLTLKNLKTGDQNLLEINELINYLQNYAHDSLP